MGFAALAFQQCTGGCWTDDVTPCSGVFAQQRAGRQTAETPKRNILNRIYKQGVSKAPFWPAGSASSFSLVPAAFY